MHAPVALEFEHGACRRRVGKLRDSKTRVHSMIRCERRGWAIAGAAMLMAHCAAAHHSRSNFSDDMDNATQDQYNSFDPYFMGSPLRFVRS